jgi:hypothetical protein
MERAGKAEREFKRELRERYLENRRNSGLDNDELSEDQIPDCQLSEEEMEYFAPSFASALWNTFSVDAMFGRVGAYKFVYDALHFVAPYLLNMLLK